MQGERGNWGTLRIHWEDWGTLGKIRRITTFPKQNPIILVGTIPWRRYTPWCVAYFYTYIAAWTEGEFLSLGVNLLIGFCGLHQAEEILMGLGIPFH